MYVCEQSTPKSLIAERVSVCMCDAKDFGMEGMATYVEETAVPMKAAP